VRDKEEKMEKMRVIWIFLAVLVALFVLTTNVRDACAQWLPPEEVVKELWDFARKIVGLTDYKNPPEIMIDNRVGEQLNAVFCSGTAADYKPACFEGRSIVKLDPSLLNRKGILEFVIGHEFVHAALWFKGISFIDDYHHCWMGKNNVNQAIVDYVLRRRLYQNRSSNENLTLEYLEYLEYVLRRNALLKDNIGLRSCKEK
jgi:hypothetical protein